MDFIVTGCAGFIGFNLVVELINQGHSVLAVYNNKIPHFSTSCECSELLSVCNYKSLDEILAQKSSDELICYDLAWSGTSGQSRSDIDLQLNNVKNRLDVLKLCDVHNMRYVGAGSVMEKESVISVYNDLSHPDYSNFYSHIKYLVHALTKSVANEKNIDYVWGRITNSYGPGEYSSRLISKTIDKLLRNETPTFSSGSQLYDFIYIDDLVRAFINIGIKGKTNTDYILGSGKPRPLKEYLNILNRIIAPSMEFIYTDEPDICKKLDYCDYDIYKLTNDTGFVPAMSFENGVKKTYEHYKLINSKRCHY